MHDEFGDVIPLLQVVTWCPWCKRLTGTVGLIAIPADVFRRNFEDFLQNAIRLSKNCCECQKPPLFLGYLMTVEASWVSCESEAEKEELEMYRKSHGTISTHPRARSSISTIAVTVLGKSFGFFEDLQTSKFEKFDEVSGRYVLELEQVPEQLLKLAEAISKQFTNL